MKRPTVVITRPLAQAQHFARRVTAAGLNCEVQVLPLLDIRPLEDTRALRECLSDLTRYAMVVFVSPNAIQAAWPHCPYWPREVSLAVMGEGSLSELAAHGVNQQNSTIHHPLDPLQTDSSTLISALDVPALRGKSVLVIRGESGRELLADVLREAGVDVHQVAAYRRLAPVFDAIRRIQLLEMLAIDSRWIITSSEGLRNLMKWVESLGDSRYVVGIQRKSLIVPHVRIAETAQSLGFERVLLTGSGDEALLAALQSSL